MSRENAIKIEGIVMEVLPNKTWQVELANGHRLRAFVPGKGQNLSRLAVGDRVKLEISLYDLSEARIIREREAQV